MGASNRDHPNARRDGRATERDKDRAALADPDIRGVRKGRDVRAGDGEAIRGVEGRRDR